MQVAMSSRLPILWVEGLPAAGKTTLVRNLSAQLNYRALYEPVADPELLGLFYTDPKRWAFPLQIEMIRRRSVIHTLAALEGQVANNPWAGMVIDRGLPGDRVFARLHHQMGNIHDAEWRIYEELFKTYMYVPRIQPSLLLYLEVDPIVAHERMKERGRDAERTVPLEYLENVQAAYEEMIAEVESNNSPWSDGLKVMRIPWSEEYRPVSPVAQSVKAVFDVGSIAI